MIMHEYTVYHSKNMRDTITPKYPVIYTGSPKLHRLAAFFS